ncbi:MAG: phosphohistidine phosphatase SixA [Planctomycetaceae bacterium]|nr:phosphohistidine phosphatase SixA [Planctomycetaceae bacterium]
MQLWLMRHGEAVDADEAGSDSARWLSDWGRNQVASLGAWLAARAPAPDVILHSPLARTTETAAILGANWGRGEVTSESVDALGPGMRASQVLRLLSSRPVESAVCVGHQPDVGITLGELVGSSRLAISPGTIACIEFRGPIVIGGGALVGLLSPDWFG